MEQKIVIGNDCYKAQSAVLTGKIELQDGVSIWHNVTMRGDTAPIHIGKNSNVQDNSCIHAGDGFTVTVGKSVSVGHGAILHGCTVEDNSIIGMGAILLNGSHIGRDCLIGAGALITSGMEVPDGMLAFGNPAKVIRPLTEQEIAHNRENAAHYVKEAKEQLNLM